MRRRRVVAAWAAAVMALVLGAMPAQAASPYDAATQSSLRNLVTAMQSWSAFDNDDRFDGLQVADLAGWGWRPTGGTFTEIVIERDGQSWRATAQDTRRGATEYTYTSAVAVNGVAPGAVRASSPQPAALPTAAGVRVVDVGMAVDVDALASAVQAGAVSYQMVCEASVFFPGTHTARSSVPDHVLACQAAAAAPNATWRSVLAAMLKAGGRQALQQVALEFVGSGAEPAAPPPWLGDPQGPQNPRPVPPSLPDGIWKIVRKADRATSSAVTAEQKRVAITQCVVLATRAGIDSMQRCDGSTPVFFSGRSDTPEPTQHDLDAIMGYPAWISLNRAPAQDRGWLDNHPACAGRERAVFDCDEFPFASTRQGGELAVPPVSLRVLDAAQNQSQGRKLGMFYGTAGCDVSDGDEFWVVPLPEQPGLPREQQLPTLAWCGTRLAPVPDEG